MKAFAHYVQYRNPEYLENCTDIITMRPKKHEKPVIPFLTEEELKTLENFVNDTITKSIDVVRTELPYNEAVKGGAYGVFTPTSQDQIVSIYTIGDVDKQICGGPHVSNTKELGKFKILKEESSSSGVRRIKAILE